MKRLVSAWWMVAVSLAGQAQNLVPNGSFEEYNLCPTTLGQVTRCIGWSVISASPDYFDRCNTNDSMDVPLNICGYQDAYDGNGYMGMFTYLEGVPTYRECIQHELSVPLTPGVPLYLSMRVSPGGYGNDPGNDRIRFASSGIGMKFSVGPEWATGLWPDNVAMHLNTVLSDTATWTQLSGVYVPDSAYEFIALGCFLADDEVVVEELDPNGDTFGAYAFVDAVCVSVDAEFCGGSAGIEFMDSPWLLVSQETNGIIDVNGLAPEAGMIQLFDVHGREIMVEHYGRNVRELRLDLRSEASGVYVLVQTTSQERRAVKAVFAAP